jgi:hypothetical protein
VINPHPPPPPPPSSSSFSVFPPMGRPSDIRSSASPGDGRGGTTSPNLLDDDDDDEDLRFGDDGDDEDDDDVLGSSLGIDDDDIDEEEGEEEEDPLGGLEDDVDPDLDDSSSERQRPSGSAARRGGSPAVAPAPAPAPSQSSAVARASTAAPKQLHRILPPSQVLRVQFGSSLHQVYPASSISYRDVIVAPALLGHENNRTHFADLCADFVRIGRQGKKDPSWSLDRLLKDAASSLADVASSEHVRCSMMAAVRQSGAVRGVVRRVCQYFSMDEASAGVLVAYRKGQPPSSYKGDTLYVATRTGLNVCTSRIHVAHVCLFSLLATPPNASFVLRSRAHGRRGDQNMVVVASFGAPRQLSFVLSSPSSGPTGYGAAYATARRRSTVAGMSLALANNSVIAVARGVFVAGNHNHHQEGGGGGGCCGGGEWEFGVRNLKPCRPWADDRASDDDSITVMIYGRCAAMEQPARNRQSSSSSPRSAKRRRIG